MADADDVAARLRSMLGLGADYHDAAQALCRGKRWCLRDVAASYCQMTPGSVDWRADGCWGDDSSLI